MASSINLIQSSVKLNMRLVIVAGQSSKVEVWPNAMGLINISLGGDFDDNDDGCDDDNDGDVDDDCYDDNYDCDDGVQMTMIKIMIIMVMIKS